MGAAIAARWCAAARARQPADLPGDAVRRVAPTLPQVLRQLRCKLRGQLRRRLQLAAAQDPRQRGRCNMEVCLGAALRAAASARAWPQRRSVAAGTAACRPVEALADGHRLAQRAHAPLMQAHCVGVQPAVGQCLRASGTLGDQQPRLQRGSSCLQNDGCILLLLHQGFQALDSAATAIGQGSSRALSYTGELSVAVQQTGTHLSRASACSWRAADRSPVALAMAAAFSCLARSRREASSCAVLRLLDRSC